MNFDSDSQFQGELKELVLLHKSPTQHFGQQWDFLPLCTRKYPEATAVTQLSNLGRP